MSVNANDLEVGHCYITKDDFVRSIIKIDGDLVTFESRGKNPNDSEGWGDKPPAIKADAFADDAIKQVDCNIEL